MKKNTILIALLFIPVFLFCQKPFAPLGAKWGGIVQCSPTFWPCPPDYPYYYAYEVTEDTVIQGKYCTLIRDRDWNWEFQNEKTIIHQDGYQIYRYDRLDEDFKLVLDFSKDVGESWQIEVPEEWAGTDTFTITVTEKVDDFRQVSVSGDAPLFTDLPLYEGYGGLAHNKRLLLGFEFFIIVDPIIWDELTCYIDPDEGLLFGNATGCEPTSTTDRKSEKVIFNVYPNPASTFIELECNFPLTKPTEWSLSNTLGQIIKSQALTPNTRPQSMLIENLANGIYFWKVHSEGKIIGTGEVMVIR